MTFESDGMKITQPLDPYKGPRYIEPANDVMEPDVLDQLYHLTAEKRSDYINPTADGSVSWRSIHSIDGDSETAFQNWQQGRYEMTSRHCASVKMVRWIGTEVRNYPTFYGSQDANLFLNSIEQV